MVLLKKVRQCCGSVESGAHGHLRVENSNSKTRLVQAYAEPPLCIRQTRSMGKVAQVFLSVLGGGMLATDRSQLTVELGEGAHLFLGTQSANRVFKSRGPTSSQTVTGHIRKNALLVHFPDALMPFAHSRLNQSQIWTLESGARLALGEIVQAGRISRGEIFTLSSFQSEWRIQDVDGKPFLVDRISLDPQSMALDAPGCLGLPGLNRSISASDSTQAQGQVFTQWASFAFCGPGWEYLESAVVDAWKLARLWPWGVAGPDDAQMMIERKSLASIWRKDENVVMARILAHDRNALDSAIKPILLALASSETLGFSPWERKF